MKKFSTLILFLALVIILYSCGSGNISAAQESPTESPESGNSLNSYSFEGTVFSYDGTDYKISERIDEVNVLMSCTESGDYIIVEGHISPKASYYGLFNTKTREFEKEFIGVNLLMHEGDIETLVYSSGADIRDYYGNVVTSFILDIGEYISDISYTDETCSEIIVEITPIKGAVSTETLAIGAAG